ncbi:MAG: hypothetical protein CMP24_01490 [Rickettsiales bacterium]|nr:hypothetical protein [Rickettsiales bacterium]
MKSFNFIGLKCHLPVLKANKILKNDQENKIFEFLCDDATAPTDFQNLAKNLNNISIEIIDKKGFYKILVKKD